MNGGAARDRILKDVNGNISDHLQNHIHLTNCIHLKNHVHKHSPNLADRALMRDLVVLQRSRSLRDPSASSNSWHSSSAVETLLGRGQKDGESTAVIDRGGSKREESNRRFQDRNDLQHQIVHRLSELRDKKSDDDDDDDDDNGDALSCNNDLSRARVGKIAEEKVAPTRIHRSKISRGKRRKFRGGRRNRPSISTREAEGKNDVSVASNSLAHGHKYYDDNDDDHHNLSGVPRNGCGLPFNWSRIHDRGKSILDMAGRSLSCGLSEQRLRKENDFSQKSSSTKSDEQSLPLLLDASPSDRSISHPDWLENYSGEIRIFADNLLNQGVDFDLDFKERRRSQRKNKHHQNLTQKYMPRTFRDIVGQNLVIQALSNAITKRKVGLLYVFYGPHGTGKTICARIFAKALNCHSVESSKKPCGFCDSCIAHEMGKSRNVKEISPVSNFDLESVIELFDTMLSSSSQHHQVFIFDECDNLYSDCWSALLKVIERAPRRAVFILVCSNLDVLPHVIISRCQKFFFPKLKDADIIYALQRIASKEDLEIDKDALKLIASRSEGSLRDAEMTLEQLSLLGERISLCLVQELVGLISDEKLVDLLDLALSADTVNTVKNLRDIMECGVEPLALMSQLATVITDILAGSYDIMKERPRRKFFRHPALSKQEMEKLRQALKTLSEAEKQLRVSNDRTTWLTAALLQLVPDQNYMLSSSSADSSLNHSPLFLNKSASREKPRKSNAEMHTSRNHMDKVEEIWLEVLEKIPINSIKEFMYQEGKLISLSYGAAPTVQLLFNSQLAKSKAEKFISHILQAFESVLRSPVTIEIRCESRKDNPNIPTNNRTPHHSDIIRRLQNRDASSSGVNRSEIVEAEASPREYKFFNQTNKNTNSTQKTNNGNSFQDERKLDEKNQNLSIVKRKVSLAHVIQHAEGYSQYNGWSKRKAVSIAEKLEQENLKLEARSRQLLCWNPPRLTRRKLSRLKVRTRKSQAIMRFVSCGRCLSGRSPR